MTPTGFNTLRTWTPRAKLHAVRWCTECIEYGACAPNSAYHRVLEEWNGGRSRGPRLPKMLIHPDLSQMVFDGTLVIPPWLVDPAVVLFPYDADFPRGQWVLVVALPPSRRLIMYDASGTVEPATLPLPSVTAEVPWSVQRGDCQTTSTFTWDHGLWMLHNIECIMTASADVDVAWEDASARPPDLRALSRTTPRDMDVRRTILVATAGRENGSPRLRVASGYEPSLNVSAMTQI